MEDMVQRDLRMRLSGNGKIESSISVCSAVFNGGPSKTKIKLLGHTEYQ